MPPRKNQEFSKDRRQAPRIPVELVIRYSNVEHFCQDYARNMSLGGIFIETANPLKVGTVLDLNFALPGYDGLICTRGRVQRVVQSDPEGKGNQASGMAVSFEELKEEHKMIIDSLVQEALVDS